ncbi:chromate transporter [Oxalobacteraceae bacterium CAVE-383]|nr:chromate transporter [Oxalobacteraceae bacterium CAVE-383]
MPSLPDTEATAEALDNVDLAVSNTRPQVSLWDVFTVFVRVGLTSFGGSTQAWVYRAVVEDRGWLTDEEFLACTAVSQILPGANPVNQALYCGQKVRGWAGATAGALGMVMPAFVVIMLMAYVYGRLAQYPITHFILIGIATAGVGATLAAGIKIATKMERNWIRYIIGLIAFVTVGILHWPMVQVVAVLAPISVLLALRRTK